MSVETENVTEIDDDHVDKLAAELGESIAQLPVYQEFLQAKAKVENDADAQRAIEEFEQLREEFQMARQTGQATQEDLRKVQEAQEELHDIASMSEYLELQNELEARLAEINDLVSEQLEVDFGEKAGGCCQD
ncbi:YlbF family regulator [Haloarcula salinisoli]|uniref:YlbF family regulator n=1 Tax=Haloarcula salinisoli TaxID=2487746 RepID=A0A8J7YHF9_9EURY|nr:YlbF family regulator [Halomicroarcula salinisoli]MBX0285467.1 YlbF family regulator [Halomicroarcula salinisoli]MBX0303054.1 YlbF family regulator [Halomicroarcula salinisoli]